MAIAVNWYLLRDGQRYGPMTAGQLKQMADAGQLSPSDMVWKEGAPNWVPVSSCRGLFTAGAPEPEGQPEAAAPAARTFSGDVRPILPRTETNCISKVEAVRDRIHDQLSEACREEGVQALLLKSGPYVMPVTLQFACWIPHSADADLRDRSSVVFSINPFEFHRYEYTIDIAMRDNGKPRKYLGVVNFSSAHARAVVRHLLRRTGVRKPTFGFTRLRTHVLQFWRPANKVVRVRQGWLPYVALGLFIVGIFTVPYFIGIFLLLGAIALLIWLAARPAYVISSGKPTQEPRFLVRLDSWQTLVPNLGPYEEKVRSELNKEFGDARRERIQLQEERIWQSGVDGIEERRQLVARLRRGQAFVHVYRYGEDLFVGWDAHVNAGDWMEKEVASGIDPNTGALCRINTIHAAWHSPGEYDLIDTVCLAEWVHAAVTKVVKRTIKEHNIDADIDFKIIRGDRQHIVGKEDSSARAEGGGFLTRVARKLNLRRES